MEYKGFTHGAAVILTKPLPVPDGTEVTIVVSAKTKGRRRRDRKPSSVAQETFGLIPADLALVQQVLQEDLYET